MRTLAIFLTTLISLNTHAFQCVDTEISTGSETAEGLYQNVRKTTPPSCLVKKGRLPVSENTKNHIERVIAKIREIDDMNPSERGRYLASNRVSNEIKSLYFGEGRNSKSVIEVSSGSRKNVESRSQVESAIIDRYVQFARDFGCRPKLEKTTKSHLLTREFQNNEKESRADVIKRVEEALASDQDLIALHKQNQTNGDLFKNRMTEVLNCNKDYKVDENFYTIVSYNGPECAQTFSYEFESNSSEISQEALGDLLASDRFKHLRSCIKKKVKQYGEAKISSIKVDATSNKLRNTGKAKHLSLDQLSEQRAKAAKEILLTTVLDGVTYDEELVKIPKYTDNQGAAGPCPYVWVDYDAKTWAELPEYSKGGSRRAELDKYKQVTINVSFDESQRKVSNKRNFVGARYACSGVKLKCK